MIIEHPYTDLTGGRWLKGNLHTHTTNSDGACDRQTVIDDYADRGYDFLMISDHDFYTSRADYAGDNARGLVLIPGNEISRHGPHMLHVGASSLIEPTPDRQVVIDEVAKDGGLTIVNHPNWFPHFNHCSQEKLSDWQGYAGLEIYNAVIGRLDGSPYATDRWDMLLTAGRRVWGFANDDSHAPQDVGQGWNMVYTADVSTAGIVSAMRAGAFYASTGVTIDSIEVDGARIRVTSPNAARIVALRATARRMAVADTGELEIEVPADARYVRFELWGHGEQFAWTQPFQISE